MRLQTLAITIAASWSLTLGVAQAQTATDVPTARRIDGYVLGVNDEVEVSILGSGQNRSFKGRIKEDGTITVPLLGAVLAVNQTPRQLSEEITRQLVIKKIYNDPIVGVEVVEFVSNSATVSGEVGTPGIYPLDRPLTIGAIVARAGGARSTGADYILLRRAGEEHRILLSEATGEWSSSTRIVSGDELYVPVAPSIYVYGQVNSAGAFSVKSHTTFLQALARAGGPTLAGTQNKITLYRGGKRTKVRDLQEEVRDGDVIYIHERFF